jgi:hypothetical protein
MHLGAQRLEIVAQAASSFVTPVRILLEAALQDAVELAWQVMLALVHGTRRVAQNGCDRRDLRIASEWALAGDHLVQQDAERENVRACIDRLAFCLLGRHVGNGAQWPSCVTP